MLDVLVYCGIISVEVDMKATRNSERLKSILESTRHQIVALKDIQIDMFSVDKSTAEKINQQILALEEVYKHQIKLIECCVNSEPKKKIWFSREDRLQSAMD